MAPEMLLLWNHVQVFFGTAHGSEVHQGPFWQFNYINYSNLTSSLPRPSCPAQQGLDVTRSFEFYLKGTKALSHSSPAFCFVWHYSISFAVSKLEQCLIAVWLHSSLLQLDRSAAWRSYQIPVHIRRRSDLFLSRTLVRQPQPPRTSLHI